MAYARQRVGRRPFDGLNGIKCFPIEAKLGYSDHLQTDWQAPGGVAVARGSNALEIMLRVETQIGNHHNLALAYWQREGNDPDVRSLQYSVAWRCSQSLMASYVTVRSVTNVKVRAFHIRGGYLPQSNW